MPENDHTQQPATECMYCSSFSHSKMMFAGIISQLLASGVSLLSVTDSSKWLEQIPEQAGLQAHLSPGFKDHVLASLHRAAQ